jgi:alkylated DNA repair dioxygenase AlkB
MASITENNLSDIENGLYFFPNFLTEKELKSFYDQIEENEWTPVTKSENSRLVQHYGYKYDYTNGKVSQPAGDFPLHIKELSNRLFLICKELKLELKNSFKEDVEFDQCINNKYLPGQGISAHSDSLLYGDIIASYTLGSGCYIDFSDKDGIIKSIYANPGSLYIMTGKSRYIWKHSIASRKNDKVQGVKIPRKTRISSTFRYIIASKK